MKTVFVALLATAFANNIAYPAGFSRINFANAARAA